MHSSPLYNKFKNYERDSSNAGWEAFKNSKFDGTALSKKVSGFSMDSNTAGWDGFAKKKRKKAVMIFWTIKVPMIVGMLCLIVFTNSKEKDPFFETLPQNHIRKEINIFNGKERETRIKKEEINVISNDLSSIEIKNNSQNNKPNTKDVGSKEDLGGGKTNLIGGKWNGSNNPISNRINTSDFKDIESSQLLIIPKKEFGIGVPEIKEPIRETVKFDKYNLAINVMNLSLLDNDFEETFTPSDFDPYYKKPILSPWYFTLQSGVTITIPKVEGNAGLESKTNKDFVSIRNNSETPGLGYVFALGVQYKYLVNLSLKTGIGLAKYRIGGTYNHIADSIPLVDLDGTIYYLPPDSTSLKPVNADAGYQYTFLTIPLGISKTLPINRNWEGIMDVSAEISILTNASGNQVDEVYVNEFKKFDKENLRKVNANLTLGLGLMRKINSDVSIGLILNHKSFLSPVNSNDKFMIRNRAFGLSLLTKINF